MRSFAQQTAYALVGLLAASLPIRDGFADAIGLSQVPIDTSVLATPNIALTYDDSSSMSQAFLPDEISPAGVGKQALCGKGYYWNGYNKIYYDPAIQYQAPAVPNGYTNNIPSDGRFPPGNVKFTSAPIDGFRYFMGTVLTKVDLSKQYFPTFRWNEGTLYHDVFDGIDIWNTNQPCLPDSVYIKQNGEITGIKAFYFTGPDINNLTLTIVGNSTPADQQNFANWYSYYRTRNLMTKTSVSVAMIDVGTNFRLVYQNLTASPFTSNTQFDEFIDTPRVNFFKWLYNISGDFNTPNRTATRRAGELFKRPLTQDLKDPYWNGKQGVESADLACRQNFHMLITDGTWSDIGNPPPPDNFQKVTEPRVLPDGHAYTPETPNTFVYSHQAPTSNANDCDNFDEVGCNPTLAELGYHYWASDLQPALADKVPPYITHLVAGKKLTDDEVYFHPDNNPASWQHLVQYMITLGVDGKLAYPSALDQISAGNLKWPAVGFQIPENIDDTWHAAVNSRGSYLKVNNTQLMIDAVKKLIFEMAITRKGVSTSSATTSSSILTTGNLAFSTGYDSLDWSGYLDAYAVDPETGKLGPAPVWSAPLPMKPDTRTILSASDIGAGKGIEFKWASLAKEQKNFLNINPDTEKEDALGSSRVEYLRGDDSLEGAPFRVRTSTLGAIIDSQAVYISFPTGGYRNDFGADAPETQSADVTYEKFAQEHKDRLPTLYVGANDGMLHAFAAAADPNNADIQPGSELFAYVPYTVYPNLSKLTGNSFSGKFQQYVNSTPVVHDVFFGGAWHTVLIGSMRFGGRGVFALDVTNPKLTDVSKVLWEFNNTSPGGEKLGYTYGTPNIARLAKDNAITGKANWVVLVPGGYIPSDGSVPEDDPAFAQTKSSLFVIDVETGELLKELVTPGNVLSSGLAAPVVGDYDDDQIDDVVYAADLVGNLFRMDLHTGKVELAFTTGDGDQSPITVMPRLFPDPVTQKFIVLFGTGKYIGSADANIEGNGTRPKAIYGIRDYGESSSNYPIIPAQLVAQQMKNDGLYREVTDNPVPSTKRGWFIKLGPYERVTAGAGALFNTNRALFSIITPSKDSCAPGRTGALMLLDAANGGPADGGESFGGNGSVGGFTRVGIDIDTPPASGVVPVVGALGGGKFVVPGTTLTDGTGRPISGWDNLWKRQSWRDLEIPFE